MTRITGLAGRFLGNSRRHDWLWACGTTLDNNLQAYCTACHLLQAVCAEKLVLEWLKHRSETSSRQHELKSMTKSVINVSMLRHINTNQSRRINNIPQRGGTKDDRAN